MHHFPQSTLATVSTSPPTLSPQYPPITPSTATLPQDHPQFPHPNLKLYLGPDRPGKIILTIVFIFLCVCGLVFWYSSHVVRDLPYSSDQIAPVLADAESKLFSDIFTIPLHVLVVTPIGVVLRADDVRLSKVESDLTQEITTNLKNTLLSPQSIDGQSVSFDIKLTTTPAMYSTLHDLHLNDLDDLVQSSIFSTSTSQQSSTLTYVLIPSSLPHSQQIPHFTFYTGKYMHSIAYYPSTHFSTPSPSQSPLPTLISTQLKESLTNTLWAQLQPSFIVATPRFSNYLKTISQPVANTSSHSQATFQHFSTINTQFINTFGISILDYLNIRIPLTQSMLQLDFTLLHHSPPLNEHPIELHQLDHETDHSYPQHNPHQLFHYTIRSPPSINATLLHQALDSITENLSPGLDIRTTITTNHLSTVLSTPAPTLIKQSSSFAQSLAQKQHKDATPQNQAQSSTSTQSARLVNFFAIESSQLQSLATKHYADWKRNTELTPSSAVDFLLGPPKVVNFVALHPNLNSYLYSNMGENCENHGSVVKLGSFVQNILVLDTTGKSYISNNESNRVEPHTAGNSQPLSFSQLTSSLLNTVQIPHWGTASIIAPAFSLNSSPGNASTCSTPYFSNDLTPMQQFDLVHTFMTNLKLLLGISPPHRPFPTPYSTLLHPSNSIPLPQWQKSLFFRSSSWTFFEHISTTLQSSLKLLESSSHMPFPPHLSHIFTSAYQFLISPAAEMKNYKNKQQQHQQHQQHQPTQEQSTSPTPSTQVSLNDRFAAYSLSNQLSYAVFYHSDLIPQLFFPSDQLLAIYAPFFAPIIVPIFSACVKLLYIWLKQWKAKRALAATTNTE